MDWTPYGDIELYEWYAIKNATNITADYINADNITQGDSQVCLENGTY